MRCIRTNRSEVFRTLCALTLAFWGRPGWAQPAAAAAVRALDNPAERAASGSAEPDAAGDTPTTALAGGVSERVLTNELRVLYQAIPSAPTVSVCTAIEAGARRDPVGAPGAHRALAEILKWGGYRNPGQDYEALVARRGGVCEVEVTPEATVFCTTVPETELGLALWVTAGRFTSAALSKAELTSAIERLALLAEETDAQVVSGRAPTRLRKMAFLGTYEYAHPELPNPDDLDALDIEQLRSLHQEAYVARRAVIAISGGLKESYLLEQLPRQLAAVRTGSPAPVLELALVPQSTQRFSMAEDNTAKTPSAWYGWVASPREDQLAMNATLALLVGKDRLTKTLMAGSRAAKDLTLHLDQPADPASPALSRLAVTGSNSSSLGLIEKQLDTELRALWNRPPSEAQVRDVERQLYGEAAKRLETSLGRARELSRGGLFGKSPERILAPLGTAEDVLELTPERLRQAAATLLLPHRRVTVEVYPKGWQDPWQTPMPLFHIVEKGQSLGSIARHYGTTVAVITKMNGINERKPIYPGDKLKVPRGKVKKERKLRTHEVRRGDTLSGLAVKYGVSVSSIADVNGMGTKLNIRSGETLRIPWPKKDDGGSSSSGASGSGSSSSALRTHKVTAGETLSGIAHRYGVSTVALAQANGVSHKALVRIGQTLSVPPPGTGKSSAVAPKVTTHTVKSGDTLIGIAQRYGVSVAQITVANQISRKSTLRPGQKLSIPQKK